LKQPPPNAAQIDQKLKELAKKPAEKRPPDMKVKSEELEKLEAELDKIANKPHSTREEIHERVKEMAGIEDQMKALQKEMAEKANALKARLQKLDTLANNSKDGEGPAKELQKALSEGKFEKAKEEIERIKKRLERGEMTKKEKEQLQRQLENMKNKLERMAQQKDKQEELKKANLDPETLQREMAALKKESQKLKDLQNLADKLDKVQQALKDGDISAASKDLAKTADKLKSMEGEEQDLDDLRDQLKRLKDAKDAAEGDGMKNDGDPQETELFEDAFDQPGAIGAGKRPESKEKAFKSRDSRIRAEFDPKGKKIFDGYAPGQNFRKKTGAELIGEIKQASQEAPEAMEQQRIPKAARDMARGYFQKMREQAERDEKAPK
jgi:hypothetical protein